MIVVDNKKLLCYSESYCLYSKNGCFHIIRKADGHQIKVKIPYLNKKHALLSKSKLFNRALRLDPKASLMISNDKAIVSVDGSLLFIDLNNGNFCREHFFRSGMKNTLNLVAVHGIFGFDDCVLYGEYFGNKSKESVSIFKRNEKSCWEVAYSFEPGEILHIHNIVPWKEQKGIIVLTGDSDSESAIWLFRNNFKERTCLLKGKQFYRSCIAFTDGDTLVYATDTPLQNNAIYKVTNIEKSPTIEKLFDMPGPCIYGRSYKNEYVFATSVEPDSEIKGWKYLLTNKRGQGVKDNKSHLIVGNINKGFREIVCKKKDIFPMGLFQFGTFVFPNGTDKELLATCQSLAGLDRKTISLDCLLK